MPELFEHKRHLVRIALLFAAGMGAFLILRALAVPSDFGLYGHFRGGALEDNRTARPLAHAGRAACAACHEEEAKALAGGKHLKVGCESCHGPLARHADDPETVKGVRPDGRLVCVRCHAANVAKPHAFPQVDVAEHAGDQACIECHQPHAPSL
jgi:hypothetical protein